MRGIEIPGRSSLADSRLKGSAPPEERIDLTSSNFFLLPVTNVTVKDMVYSKRVVGR